MCRSKLKATILFTLIFNAVLAVGQHVSLDGNWKVYRSYLMVTSDIEDKAFLTKNCNNSVFRISHGKILTKHPNNCFFENIESFDIIDSIVYNRTQVTDTFYGNLAYVLFQYKNPTVKILITNYIEHDCGSDPLRVL